MLPWRIGPFKLGSYLIDSEWRSSIKWERIASLLPPLEGARIADVGCSNGYFLFRLAHLLHPSLALGFDPINRCWLQSTLLRSMFRLPQVGMLPLGLDSLSMFPNFFDLTVCMGVLYHQRDPYEAVRTLVAATKPGGTILLESLVIDTDDPVMLIPQERYAKMRNAWMIPSPPALANLLERAGCTRIETHHFGPITTSEQRRTLLAPFESLEDFLDPHDRSRTIEGYPAPHSAAVLAVRKGG
jgi:tRNA (mo5U34)-methyltransferase